MPLHAPSQAAQVEVRIFQQHGGPRRQVKGHHGRTLLTDADRILVTVEHLDKGLSLGEGACDVASFGEGACAIEFAGERIGGIKKLGNPGLIAFFECIRMGMVSEGLGDAARG